MSQYHEKVSSYFEFTESNKDYASLKNSEDRWLLNDIAYMSQQLQKAATKKTQKQEISDHYYSLEEIALASRMIDAVKGYIERKINQENDRIFSMYDEPYYYKDGNPIYDISAIYAVSEKFLSIY